MYKTPDEMIGFIVISDQAHGEKFSQLVHALLVRLEGVARLLESSSCLQTQVQKKLERLREGDEEVGEEVLTPQEVEDHMATLTNAS